MDKLQQRAKSKQSDMKENKTQKHKQPADKAAAAAAQPGQKRGALSVQSQG